MFRKSSIVETDVTKMTTSSLHLVVSSGSWCFSSWHAYLFAPAKTGQNICCQKGLVILGQTLLMSTAIFVLPEYSIRHNGALYWSFDEDDDAMLPKTIIFICFPFVKLCST